MKNKPIYADLSLLIVAFIWGATFVVVQNAISILPPFSFNVFRFSVASVILFAWVIFVHKELLKLMNKKLFFSGMFLGFWLFFGYATQTVGLLYTTSSRAGFITGLSVVLVPVFAFLIFKQKLTKNATIGVLIATVGLYFLTMTDFSSINKGDMLVFFGAISFAMHIVMMDKYAKQFPALLLTAIQLFTVAFFSLFSSFIFEDWKNIFTDEVLFHWKIITSILITAVLATSFAFFAQTYFQQFTSPTRVALIFATEPVFAAITAYIYGQMKDYHPPHYLDVYLFLQE